MIRTPVQRMPRTDIDLDAGAVRRLITGRFPEYAGCTVTELDLPGSQNLMFRLGDDLCVRLPRRGRVVGRLANEVRWLPAIAARSPLEVPTPVVTAGPSDDYPMPWAVYRWVDGRPLATGASLDGKSAARLAEFVLALRTLPAGGAPLSQQDRPPDDRDRDVRQALPRIGAVLDPGALAAAWERLSAALPWTGVPTWTHGDLLPPNLLTRGGQLAAVIDFGCAGLGDPALDLLPAWAACQAAGRNSFRRALGVDARTWRRGQAFALHQAVVIAASQLAWDGPLLATAVQIARTVLSEL